MKKHLFIIAVILSCSLKAQVFVNAAATGANNGTSWADAYTDLHSATYNTTSGEIWVAQGTYVPSRTFTGNIPANNSQKTFRVQHNVQVYGGFNGTETLLSQRDWQNNPTIISGDVGGGLKAYNVIRFDANNNTTVLDGFTVRDGQANGTSEFNGGAIYLTNTSSPTIRNCRFQDNIANQYGGAIYSTGGTLKILNCEFVNNRTNTFDGGAIYMIAQTGTEVVNCLFDDNYAGRYAAAMLIINSSNVQVTNSTFVNNQIGGGSGNAIQVSNSSGSTSAAIDNCVFYNNGPVLYDVAYNGTVTLSVENSFAPNVSATSTLNVLSGNPLFTDFANGDYTLQCASPLVNSGNATGLNIPATDLTGNPRTFGPSIDMGAFENTTTQISVVANKLSVCAGDFVILRGSCDPTGYTWSNGVVDGIAFYPTSTQTYTCTGISNSTTAQITIEVITIGDEAVSGPASVCAGSPATITLANSTTGAAYFLCDSATGIIVDGPVAGTGSSIQFNTGNLSATTTYNVTGAVDPLLIPIPGQAIDFDGTNDRVITNYFFPTTTQLSIEAWIYPEAGSYKRILTSFSGGTSYASDVIFDTYNATNNGQGLRLVIGTSTTASVANVLTLSAWNHVAATFNSGVIAFYVNGTSVGTFTVATTTLLTNVTRSLTIAEDYVQGASAEYFNGRIDEVRIWKRTLSQSEIAANMNTCLNGDEDSLEVYYRMNEGTGTTLTDLSGNGYNGTLATSDALNHWVTSGHSCGSVLGADSLGHALDFDGTNDKVATTFKMPATTAFTIESWLYPRSTNYDRVISNGDGVGAATAGEIVIDTYDATGNGRGVRFNVSNSIISASNALTLNAWNHVACVFSNGAMAIFVNGFEVINGTAASSSLPAIAAPFAFGEDNVTGTAEFLNGKMDEVRFWNKALSQTEILADMNNCLTGTETDLLAYYNFEDASGSVVSDLTSDQNNGTMQQMDPATDWVSGKFTCEMNCTMEMTQTVTVNVTSVSNAISSNGFTTTAGQGGAAYRWLDCNNGYAVIPGETFQGFTPTVNGSYAVEVSLNGCTDTSACVIFNSVSLKDPANNSFAMFPNPTPGVLTVQTREPVETIEVYNLVGVLLQTETKNVFSVEQLPAGLYLVKIKTAHGAGTVRLIKE